jgi:hypothetical protein
VSCLAGVRLARFLLVLFLLPAATLSGAQTVPPPAAARTTADTGRGQEALQRELDDLRRQVQALTQRVETLTRALAQLSSQAIMDVSIQAVTDYFAGPESAMQPQVIASYPGRLVSANITLIRTERYGGTESYGNGRSVTVVPGGSAAIPVEGAGAPCSWVVYDERNSIRVRSENCSYLSPGLRGYFAGVAYFRQ